MYTRRVQPLALLVLAVCAPPLRCAALAILGMAYYVRAGEGVNKRR